MPKAKTPVGSKGAAKARKPAASAAAKKTKPAKRAPTSAREAKGPGPRAAKPHKASKPRVAKAKAGPSSKAPRSAARPKANAPQVRPKTIPLEASDAAASWDVHKARAIVGRLRARWPSLGRDERRAFDGLSSAEERSRLGRRTKARAVAAEATGWATVIDRQLAELAIVREHYDPRRFSYYLERLDALLVELINVERGEARAASATLESESILAARDTRRRLLLALERFAGRRTAFRTALEAGRGSSSNLDDLTQSLRALVGLSSMWIESGDPFLLAAARLTPELIAAGRAAALAVGSASADLSFAGSAVIGDAPAVNLVEGWVVEEMIRVHADVDAAKEDNDAVRRLEVGPALRNVIAAPSSPSADGMGEPARPSRPPSMAPAPPEEPLA